MVIPAALCKGVYYLKVSRLLRMLRLQAREGRKTLGANIYCFITYRCRRLLEAGLNECEHIKREHQLKIEVRKAKRHTYFYTGILVDIEQFLKM